MLFFYDFDDYCGAVVVQNRIYANFFSVFRNEMMLMWSMVGGLRRSVARVL